MSEAALYAAVSAAIRCEVHVVLVPSLSANPCVSEQAARTVWPDDLGRLIGQFLHDAIALLG